MAIDPSGLTMKTKSRPELERWSCAKLQSAVLQRAAMPSARLQSFGATFMFAAALMATSLCCFDASAGEQGGVRPGNPYSHHRMMMYDRPELTANKSYPVYQDGLKELWLRALERPDAELQRLVVDSFALAHHRGHPGMQEAIDRLAAILNEPETRLDVQRSVAQTLVVMEARQHADKLAELSKRYGASVAPIIEPALTRWRSDALQEV